MLRCLSCAHPVNLDKDVYEATPCGPVCTDRHCLSTVHDFRLHASMRSLANFMVWVEMEAMYQSPEHRYKLRGDPLVWSLRSGKLRLEYP